ncbi:hypothetical protein [Actinomadura bangladeshensis]|uniref:Uncharacterized protein n=1 Tax=Actinomadura bangladeshensis TaxID=453573 RepID=A0A4V2XLV5_9ACTN|nr:hypothetical protein [Actinomadura bangladeshensis]TDC11856.1 hypothetical protein E1284_26530 [Actinomadura bangladeshensis]
MLSPLVSDIRPNFPEYYCDPYVVDAARAAFLGDYATAALAEGALVTVVLLVVSVALGARRFRAEAT